MPIGGEGIKISTQCTAASVKQNLPSTDPSSNERNPAGRQQQTTCHRAGLFDNAG